MNKYIIDPIVYSDIDCDYCAKPIPYKSNDGEKHQLNCMTFADDHKQLHLYCYPVWLEKNKRIDTDLSNPARFPIPQ